MKRQMILLIVVLTVGLMAGLASAQVTPISYTGVVEENFDSIGATGTAVPAGWIAGNLVGNPSRIDPPNNSVTDDPLFVDDGSSTTKARAYNYGTTGDPDRAVGFLPTTSGYGDAALQVALVNNTGGPITTLGIAYTMEQWRKRQCTSTSGPEILRLYISDAVDFSGNVEKLPPEFEAEAPQDVLPAEVKLDGNDPANRVEIEGEYTLTTPIPAGATFYITWHDFESDATNDHLLCIDDVVITLPGVSSLVEYTEDFESGFGGSINNHAEWYSSPGPTVSAGVGVAGSVGLAASGNIFTWTAHPFKWSDLAVGDVVIMGMDFEAIGTSAPLDDDRVGWMIKDDTTGSNNIFGVQGDPKSGSGQNIECYWDDVSFGDNGGRQTIVDTTPANGTWYRMTSTFTKLTDTSCSIDVEFVDLDGSGNPAGIPVTGSIADTSALANDPMVQYFNGLPGYSNTLWPAFKNHSGNSGNADNAYFAIGTP